MKKTILHKAATHGSIPFLATLLRKSKPDVNAADADGNTPLHAAVSAICKTTTSLPTYVKLVP